MQFVLQFAELRGELRTVGPKGLFLLLPLFQEQTYVFTLVVQLVLLGGVLPVDRERELTLVVIT